MPRSKKSQEPLSRSASRSPLASSGEKTLRADTRASVAFVPFDIHSSSGVNSGARKAVRIQAAKASAAARKRTIARKAALQSSAIDDRSPSAEAPDNYRGRSVSATSSSQSQLLKSPASPVTTSTRSLSAGQLESFSLSPVPEHHPQIAAIVDHFLRYFAPEHAPAGSGREALRGSLWPQALGNPALFYAILLLAGSHASVSGALQVPTDLLAHLKHSTIEGVNNAIAQTGDGSGIKDPVVGAIALLGGWELEYGNVATYDTHMRGLETIVNLRGGLHGTQSPLPGFEALCPEVVDVILSAAHDLAIYASKTPYVERETNASATDRHAAIPTGFANLILQRLIPPDLVNLVSKIARIVSIDHSILAELANIERLLARWTFDVTIKAGYSPFQTNMEDNIQRQICSHVCTAGQVLCNYLRVIAGLGAEDKLEDLYGSAKQLQVEILIGTHYDEVTFWSWFMICSLTGRCESQHMRALKRLSLELGLDDWFACRQALGRFAYSSAILDGRAFNLWEAISSSTVAQDASKTSHEPTRFAKGIRHPTTHIGRAIVAEENSG